MELKLHANARTTPKIREYIQKSNKTITALAEELHLSRTTVHKWKKRDTIYDGSHTRHNLLASTNDVEERLIYELRIKIGLSLNDIVEVMNRCGDKKLNPSFW